MDQTVTIQKRYPTTYEPSFVVFWGLSMAFGIYCGGILLFALVCLMVLLLLSHEYAHVRESIQLGVKVEKVVFTWLGGMTHCDSKTNKHTISICNAGLLDTSYWCISFILLLGIVQFVGSNNGWNFADSSPLGLLYWIRMLNGIITFSVVAAITNILPIEYYHKTHGLITTDGWACIALSRINNLESKFDTKVQSIEISP